MAKCDECGKKFPFLEPRRRSTIESRPYAFCHDTDCQDSFLNKCFSNSEKGTADVGYEERKQKNLALENMLFVSDNVITGARTVKTLGTARGATVRAKHVGRDIAAGLKNFVGGEIKGYTELLAEGREEAIQRMKEDALRMGANAIIMTRFSTSMIEPGAVEVMAYGTAIVSESRGEEDV